MAEPRKDRSPSSRNKIEQMYQELGLYSALRKQTVAGNETGDRELPEMQVRPAVQRRERRVIVNGQNT